MSKLKERAHLAEITAKLRKKGKKVVFANGCFDVVHVGHARFLKAAKAKGDVLVLGLNSDSSVRRLKGRGRPLVPEKERAEIMASFEAVDYIVIFRELTVDKTLEALRPYYHAKGTDYTKDTVPEKELAEKLGIKIAIVGDRKNHSTKDIIKTVLEKEKK
ncbi:MAG: adenylyltransferase/cytidyltransferase family protein [Candidatus Goldiibacteriota bacterium]